VSQHLQLWFVLPSLIAPFLVDKGSKTFIQDQYPSIMWSKPSQFVTAYCICCEIQILEASEAKMHKSMSSTKAKPTMSLWWSNMAHWIIAKNIRLHYLKEWRTNHCPNMWSCPVSLANTCNRPIPLVAICITRWVPKHHTNVMFHCPKCQSHAEHQCIGCVKMANTKLPPTKW